MQSFVPGISLRKSPPQTIDLWLEHVQTNPQLSVKPNRIQICDFWQNTIPDEAYRLFYGMVRQHLLEKGLYIAHAACVGNTNGFILICGPSGSGKTSVLLNYLNISKEKLLSDNKTVLGFRDSKLYAGAGTTTITTSITDAIRLPKQTKLKFNQRIGTRLTSKRYTHKPQPIHAIVFPHLDDTKDTLTLITHNALQMLYPVFMDTVNADVVLAPQGDIFTSTPPADCQKQLVTQLGAIDIPIYIASGSSLSIAKRISAL